MKDKEMTAYFAVVTLFYMAASFAHPVTPTLIVERELDSSMFGIALASICAHRWGKPMVFAKKAKSDNIEGGLYQSDIFSYTYKKKVTLLVSKEWLSADDRVLIVDDFMANGEAMRGLCDIVANAGATLVGVGCAVEKGFQGGGDRLRAAGVNLKSLAIIESAEPGNIVFRDDD